MDPTDTTLNPKQPPISDQPVPSTDTPLDNAVQQPVQQSGQQLPQQLTNEPIQTNQGNQQPETQGKSKTPKTVATILGVLLLVGSVATGVYLVGQQQRIRIGAWDCENYVFNVSEGGLVTTRNGSTRNEPAQEAIISINGTVVATLDIPALTAGDSATLGTVQVPDGEFSWFVEGTRDCENDGEYVDTRADDQINEMNAGCNGIANCKGWGFFFNHPLDEEAKVTAFVGDLLVGSGTVGPSEDATTFVDGDWIIKPNPGDEVLFVIDYLGKEQTRTGIMPECDPDEDPTPTITPPPEPTLPPDIIAQCNAVIAYDLNWNSLTSGDLSELEEGDVVRFSVTGTATVGNFDQARFTINGALRPAVSTTKPGTNIFYDEYTIPTGVETFEVDAQVHHLELGWI